jgi:DNA helicase II / ATP-dependent DNA helicase PcrA
MYEKPAGLNEQQAAAATSPGGIDLVIAGAGTGKTRTLVERIRHLLESGAATPEDLLVLTFSRKAAEEIRERVMALGGERTRGITAGTFHSFCLSMLREYQEEYRERARLDAFPRTIDGEERSALLLALIQGRLEEFKGIPAAIIGRLLDEFPHLGGVSRDKLARTGLLHRLEELRADFNKAKRERGLIDFDDMMEGMIGLLESRERVQKELSSRFKFILVDEFQDTSERNFRLVTLLLPQKDKELFVVGDDWQSIYAFRDSRVEYIVRFKRFFPEARIHALAVNYRSAGDIVKISNRFIRRNRFRTRKLLRAHRRLRGAVEGREVGSFEQELEEIGGLVPGLISRHGRAAILFRNNWQGRVLRKSLPALEKHEQEGTLAMLTMHASKGLEFPAVVICGVSDEVIPDSFAPLEEERRLFYVALTRAMDSLHVLYHRNSRGGIARFAREMGFRPRKAVQGSGI